MPLLRCPIGRTSGAAGQSMSADMSACLDRPCICERSLDVTRRCTPHKQNLCNLPIWGMVEEFAKPLVVDL